MEEVAPESYDPHAIAELFAQYGSRLEGLNLRTSRELVEELGYRPLRETMHLAKHLGMPVMYEGRKLLEDGGHNIIDGRGFETGGCSGRYEGASAQRYDRPYYPRYARSH